MASKSWTGREPTRSASRSTSPNSCWPLGRPPLNVDGAENVHTSGLVGLHPGDNSHDALVPELADG
eukprot:9107138-Pyramimonas_sp.AAC.1